MQLNQQEMKRRYDLRQAYIDRDPVLSGIQATIDHFKKLGIVDPCINNAHINKAIERRHSQVIPQFVDTESPEAVDQTLANRQFAASAVAEAISDYSERLHPAAVSNLTRLHESLGGAVASTAYTGAVAVNAIAAQ